MKKKFYIALVIAVIVIIIGGILLFLKNKTEIVNSGSSAEITYTYEDETTDSEIQIESQDFKPTE